ncbi:unnamed protein product [Mytilus coruscus]|uniref:Chromo domain-containing protein n=1 Tax=Mytilus coruscus TaxID=42192 RepID=A0A6J8DMR7_MYTCO|nr:unnamed protein product [Mytilus coruscus]
MIFDRSYDEHFTREILRISQRMRMQVICVYLIKIFMDQPVLGHFYESELQKVNKDEDALWFIEKKIKKRKLNGEVQCFVKFDGWSDKYNQWIPEKDITDVFNWSQQTVEQAKTELQILKKAIKRKTSPKPISSTKKRRTVKTSQTLQKKKSETKKVKKILTHRKIKKSTKKTKKIEESTKQKGKIKKAKEKKFTTKIFKDIFENNYGST